MKKVVPLHSLWKTGGQRGWEFLSRLTQKNKIEKFWRKIWKLKNNAYLCSPVRKTGPRKRVWEVHWKDCSIVQEASTEKNNLSRSVNSFERIISVSDKLEIYKKLYNEEFDPGSGWTLAAGLTHASRGAAWDGDSSKSWWRPAQGCVTREQLARIRGITGGNAD